VSDRENWLVSLRSLTLPGLAKILLVPLTPPRTIVMLPLCGIFGQFLDLTELGRPSA